MRYRLLSLACAVGISAVLLTGCTANDNDRVGTRSINRGSNALGVNPNATTINGNGRSVYRNLSATDGNVRSRTYGPAGYATPGMYGAGTSGFDTSGRTSAYGNNNNGFSGTDRNRDVLILGNLIIVGTDPDNRNTNRAGNGAGGGTALDSGRATAPGTTGMTQSRSAASNGRVAPGLTTQTGTAGTTGAGNVRGTGTADSNGFVSLGTARWSDDLQVLQTQFGQTFKVVQVTDRKAVAAIRRVKRTLSSDTSLPAKTSSILNDLPYILTHTSDATNNNRAGGR